MAERKAQAVTYPWQLLDRAVPNVQRAVLAQGVAAGWDGALLAIKAAHRRDGRPAALCYGLVKVGGNWQCTGPP